LFVVVGSAFGVVLVVYGDVVNQLYRNIGGGEFEKVTTGAPVTDSVNSYSAAWGDYDGDGLLEPTVDLP
jgi:hypothetical protein